MAFLRRQTARATADSVQQPRQISGSMLEVLVEDSFSASAGAEAACEDDRFPFSLAL